MLGNEGKKSLGDRDFDREVVDKNLPTAGKSERPCVGKGEYWLPPEETPNNANLFAGFNEDTPEEAGEEETGPLETRLESRVWKTRAIAYDELCEQLVGNKELLSRYSSLLPKFMSDSHPGPQEKSLELFRVYLSESPNTLVMSNETYVKLLIEKGVASSKTSISKTASVLIFDFFAEHRDNFNSFIEGLVLSLNNKNAKIQSSALATITGLMAAFGAKLVPFKPFLPTIEKLAGNSNAGVRNESLNFYKEAYKWVRELIIPSVGKLKKAQQEELQKVFEEIEEAPYPTRWLKSEEGKKPEVPLKPRQVDVYEMAEERDIFSKFNEKWADSVLEMDKWTDKKQALEALNTEANYPKLAEKNPFTLVTLAKRLLNDSNVNVMLQAVKLVGLLAKGQRRYFESYAKQFFSLFFSKLKDKKTQVIQEVFLGLECLLYSVNVEQVTEEIKEALDDKTPTLKINVTLWLAKVYSTLPSDQLARSVKPVVLLLKRNLDDSVAEVRAETFKLLNLMWRKFPDIVSGSVKDLPQIKIKKIEGEDFVQDDEVEKPAKVEKPVKVEKPAKVEKEAKTVKKEKPKNEGKKEGKNDEDFSAAISAEEAENVLSNYLSSDTVEKLKENNWKGKVEGLQELNAWLVENEEVLSELVDCLFVFLKTIVKDWKETNVNVIKSAIELINFLSSKATISKRSAYLILTPQALDKLSDRKVAESFASCIIGVSESVTPKFVVSYIIKNTADCSKPNVISECFSVINRVVCEFGPHRINLKELVEYIKGALNQANPVIKKSAQTVTVTLYTYLGDSLLPLLTDIKEATMKALQEDFSRTILEVATEFRQIRGEEDVPYDAKKAIDELIPRVNVSSSITPAMIKKLADQNWKDRKDALDSIEEVLDKSGKRIVSTGLDELFKSLKARLDDSNKSIVRSTLMILSKLAECLGPEAAGFSKTVVPGVLANLADKQSLLRQDALATIDKWSSETGAENVIMFVAVPLTQDNPEQRTELLNWLIAHKEVFSKCDVKPMVPGIIACLQDKTANIRNAAETLFGEVVEIVGFDSFTPFLKDIKPAVMNSLKQVFDKYRTVDKNLDPSKSKKNISKEPEGKNKARGPGPDIRIIDPGDKDRRLDFDLRYKWSLDEIRPDYLEKLKEQLKAACSADLYALLFHSDFKKQAEAAVHFTNIIKSSGDEIIPYLDLLFKWNWIELITTNNTQIYKAAFELDQLIISQLESFGYVLSDAEAGLIIPVLCEKSGQNNQTFRTMIRSIIHSCCKVYSPEKVFSLVMQGLNSKNAKSKSECLEECGSLIVDHGIEILQTKDVKTISKQIASADANVRSAAADAITEIYKIVGDKIWTVLGDVPDKIRGILDQRFRTVKVKNPELGKIFDPFKTEVPKVEITKVPEKRNQSTGKEKGHHVSHQASERIIGLDKLGYQEDEMEKTPSSDCRRERTSTLLAPTIIGRGEASPRTREENKGPRSIQDIRNAFKERKMQQRESAIFETPKSEEKQVPVISSITKQLKNPDVAVKTEALRELNENILENVPNYSQELKLYSKALNSSVIWTLYFVNDSADVLFSKYFFSVIQKLFQIDEFIKQLDEIDISNACEQLLITVTSDRSGFEDVMKIVNNILLKILDLGNPTEVFVATLILLAKYKVQSTGKIFKVLIKCLLKITKSLSSQISNIRVELIFINIDKYLAAEEDVSDENGVKLMKTIVNELVKLLSDDIWEYFESARDSISEDSEIENWIHLLLGSSPVKLKRKSSLDEILEKLLNEETYSSGFNDLLVYMNKNPSIDLSDPISQLGPDLERRIKRDLEDSSQPKKRSESNYNISDMQSKILQMKARHGLEPQSSATSSTADLKTAEPVKESSIPQPKSRIQKLTKK